MVVRLQDHGSLRSGVGELTLFDSDRFRFKYRTTPHCPMCGSWNNHKYPATAAVVFHGEVVAQRSDYRDGVLYIPPARTELRVVHPELIPRVDLGEEP